MSKKSLSIIFLLATYVLLFFALWFYSYMLFAPYHNNLLNPFDLAVNEGNWDWVLSKFFYYHNGSYLLAGLSLWFGIRPLVASQGERNYFRLALNNIAFYFLLVAAFIASLSLNYFLLPVGLFKSFCYSIIPLLAYLGLMIFWLRRQSGILENADKAKHSIPEKL